jgi:trigger factor
MNVEVTEIGPCRREVVIEIDAAAIEELVSEQVGEYRRTRAVPGFRPGRATAGIIRRKFGKQIRADVLRDMVPQAWSDALTENDLVPLNQPEMDSIDDEDDGGLKIAGKVDIKPQVELEDYKGMKATRRVRPVGDEDVDRQLSMIREQRASETAAERPAESGDIVVVATQTVDETGVIIIGEKEDTRRWEIGGVGSLSTDLDEQMIGMEVGETRTIAYNYREDIYDKELAGNADRANITLNELFIREVPELDDEFAKDVGDFETVDDLKKAVRDDIEARMRGMSSQDVQAQLREQLGPKYDFEVPESLVERVLSGMFHEQEQAHSQEEGHEEGHEHPEEGSEEHNKALEAFSSEHRDEALVRVRIMLALDIIGEQENIEVAEEQVRQRVAMMASQYRMPPEQMMQYLVNSGRVSNIHAELRDQQVLQLLEDNAEIEEVEITDDSEDSEQEAS